MATDQRLSSDLSGQIQAGANLKHVEPEVKNPLPDSERLDMNSPLPCPSSNDAIKTEKTQQAVLHDVEGFHKGQLHKTETQEKVVLPSAEDLQQEKTHEEVLSGVEGFNKDQLNRAQTKEKIILPSKEDLQQEKTHEGVITGVEGFDKAGLKHTETVEKNPLPTKDVIEQEKQAA